MSKPSWDVTLWQTLADEKRVSDEELSQMYLNRCEALPHSKERCAAATLTKCSEAGLEGKYSRCRLPATDGPFCTRHGRGASWWQRLRARI